MSLVRKQRDGSARLTFSFSIHSGTGDHGMLSSRFKMELHEIESKDWEDCVEFAGQFYINLTQASVTTAYGEGQYSVSYGF